MNFQKELIAEYDREAARTRKILEAIPADADFTFKPNTDKLEFAADHKFEPYIPASKEALLERFDQDTAKVKAELAKFAPEKWDENWKMVAGAQTWIDETKYEVWRSWVINHMIHHRAQIGVYLRVLGKPIPGTYGPSGDEV